MDDLISRQKAIDAIKNQTSLTYEEIFNRCLVSIKDENGWVGGIKDAIEALIDLPSADAVEVVRCKDCKHWDTDWQTIEGQHFCIMVERKTKGEFFCADGYCHEAERKEE